jgi:chorismate synthase
MMKYDTRDARNILERASARETAARTVVGYLAKRLLSEIDVSVLSHVVSIGQVQAPDGVVPLPEDLAGIDASPVRVFDKGAEQAMISEIEAARADRDTLGGVVEVLAYGLPWA